MTDYPIKSILDIKREVGELEFTRFLWGARRALQLSPVRVLENNKRVEYINQQIRQRYETYKMVQETNREHSQQGADSLSGRILEGSVLPVHTSESPSSDSYVDFPNNVTMPDPEGFGE